MTCDRCHTDTATAVMLTVTDQRTKPTTWDDKRYANWLDTRRLISLCAACARAFEDWRCVIPTGAGVHA